VFGLVTEQELIDRLNSLNRDLMANIDRLEKRFEQFQRSAEDTIENLRDEKANLEQRVDELEKSYATGSIQREQNEEPAVQVAPGFQRFSQRKRNFEREHAADGMTPTGRQILANQNQVDKVQTKPKEKR